MTSEEAQSFAELQVLDHSRARRAYDLPTRCKRLRDLEALLRATLAQIEARTLDLSSIAQVGAACVDLIAETVKTDETTWQTLGR